MYQLTICTASLCIQDHSIAPRTQLLINLLSSCRAGNMPSDVAPCMALTQVVWPLLKIIISPLQEQKKRSTRRIWKRLKPKLSIKSSKRSNIWSKCQLLRQVTALSSTTSTESIRAVKSICTSPRMSPRQRMVQRSVLHRPPWRRVCSRAVWWPIAGLNRCQRRNAT